MEKENKETAQEVPVQEQYIYPTKLTIITPINDGISLITSNGRLMDSSNAITIDLSIDNHLYSREEVSKSIQIAVNTLLRYF